MNSCPSREQLRHLLGEQLREAVRVSVETHVEAHRSCQERLARLSDETLGLDRQLLGDCQPPAPSGSVAEFVRYLKAKPPSVREPPTP